MSEPAAPPDPVQDDPDPAVEDPLRSHAEAPSEGGAPGDGTGGGADTLREHSEDPAEG